MRAAVIQQYGAPEVIRITERPRPVPGPRQLLVRVVATAVTAADARIRAARFPAGFAPFARLAFGVRRPRRPVLGSCISGVVEEVGADVGGAVGGRVGGRAGGTVGADAGAGAEGFRIGDAVVGMVGGGMGAHAEYVTVDAVRMSAKPAGVSHEDAAGVLFGGTTALWFLRDRATVSAGTSVLVVGASGAIGTSAVQLARHFGGTVTAVTSAANTALVRDLGAETTIDYHATDVTRLTERFDVVFDTVGTLTPRTGRRLLKPGGVLLLAAADLWQNLQAFGPVKAGVTPERASDVAYLLDLVAAGTLRVVHDPVGSGDLAADLVAAHRRIDSGRKVGNIVLHP